jgi:hypothetical protein
MDAVGYLKTVDTAVASNTKLQRSSLGVGEAMQVSASKSVKASLDATKALQVQVAGYRELAAAATTSAETRDRANLLADRGQTRLNSALGLSTAATLSASNAAKTGERDLGKFTRGALAGSGAASSLGRSLAFASTGFIAIAGGATLIAASIRAAILLQKTQRQIDTQLATSGKSWDQYGQRIDQADLKLSHISGFTNQELLQSFTTLFRATDNVTNSLHLNSVAADVARGRGISLAAASNALAKAAEGSFSALRRLNIIVPKGSSVLEALTFVQQKYAGQAAAGATVSDKFHAALVNTEEEIGTGLLPGFTKATTAVTDWLAKMTQTGRLQKDVNDVVSTGGTVFHTLGAAIGFVDKVTGSFGNTLKLILGVYLGREIVKGILGVDKLAASWAGVATSANSAAAAEERAVAVGTGAGAAVGGGVAAGAAGGSLLFGGFAAKKAALQAERAAALKSAGFAGKGAGFVAQEAAITSTGVAAAIAGGKIAALRAALSGISGLTIAAIGIPIVLNIRDRITGPLEGLGGAGKLFSDLFINSPLLHPERLFHDFQQFGRYGFSLRDTRAPAPPLIPSLQRYGGSGIPAAFQPGGILGQATRGVTGPFGTATPMAIYAKYAQTISQQIAVAQAALTKTTVDDVAIAKKIIARIKHEIDTGQLSNQALLGALQDEATQQAVLNSARAAAAAQAAALAAAKKAAASSYTTPIDLQLAEARAQLTKTTADDVAVEKQILAAAKAAIAAGKKNKQGELAALQVELQAQQALASLRQQSATSFVLPARLQLALAKAQATNADQTPILKRMKAALERALKAAKGNIQKQIDIYNQITAINSQLQSSVTNAYGAFKKASVKALTASLGLTAVQRRELEQRLSRRGPGGTIPATGTGAGGFIIDPVTGRPIQLHRHRRPRYGRDTGGTGADGGPRHLQATVNIRVYLEGKDITRNVTIEQQRYRRGNPSSRRGPNAGVAHA